MHFYLFKIKTFIIILFTKIQLRMKNHKDNFIILKKILRL